MDYTSQSIADRIVETKGRASGFDYLRLSLAISVILFHSIVTSYGPATQATVVSSASGALWALVLPMFFALSGFLVAGSLDRTNNLFTFLGLRILRIFPALAVDTFFCALVLGPHFTTLPLSSYFRDTEFASYFLNILGQIHYKLPGTFETNPITLVNGQLWTIPSELGCYVTLAVLALLGLNRRKWLFLAALIALVGVLEVRILFLGVHINSERELLICFLSGVTLFLFRDDIRLTVPMLAVSLCTGL